MTRVIDRPTYNASTTALLPSATVDADSCGQMIRQTAAEQGVTRKQLAKKSGIKPARLERCWNGDGGEYTLPEIARIAAALDVVPAYFFGDWITNTPVRLPEANEAGLYAVPVGVMDREKPRPGDVVQVTRTEDPRRARGITYHVSIHTRQEGLAWCSESGIICTVGGLYTFLGTVKHNRSTHALLGILPSSNDGNRGA